MAQDHSTSTATPTSTSAATSGREAPNVALNVALSQCQPNPLDVAGNLQRLDGMARSAHARGADVLVLPEMFITGYNIGVEAVRALAQSRSGSYYQAVAAMARQYALAMVFGYPERDENSGQIFNAAQWVDAQGQVLLNYRKTHLYGELDHSQFSAGSIDAQNQALATIKGWRCGVLICYDVEFPENARRLALAGADVVLVPTANMDRFDFVPQTMIPTRAFENQIAVAYANYCGAEGSLCYGGLSSICDALGQPLASAEREPAILMATLERHELNRARQLQTHLQDYAAQQSAAASLTLG